MAQSVAAVRLRQRLPAGCNGQRTSGRCRSEQVATSAVGHWTWRRATSGGARAPPNWLHAHLAAAAPPDQSQARSERALLLVHRSRRHCLRIRRPRPRAETEHRERLSCFVSRAAASLDLPLFDRSVCLCQARCCYHVSMRTHFSNAATATTAASLKYKQKTRCATTQ